MRQGSMTIGAVKRQTRSGAEYVGFIRTAPEQAEGTWCKGWCEYTGIRRMSREDALQDARDLAAWYADEAAA